MLEHSRCDPFPGANVNPYLAAANCLVSFSNSHRSCALSRRIPNRSRGGAAQRCSRPVGKQACDLNSLLLVICGVGCVPDLVQSQPRCGRTIRFRFVRSFPFTPNGMQFACQTVQSSHGFDTAGCPHVYDACYFLTALGARKSPATKGRIDCGDN